MSREDLVIVEQLKKFDKLNTKMYMYSGNKKKLKMREEAYNLPLKIYF
jgi:hypothetical protein